MIEKQYHITINLNGTDRKFIVEEQETLLHVLRERAGLTGAKKGCYNTKIIKSHGVFISSLL